MGQFQSKEYDGDPYVDLMRALPERELIWWVQKAIWVSTSHDQDPQLAAAVAQDRVTAVGPCHTSRAYADKLDQNHAFKSAQTTVDAVVVSADWYTVAMCSMLASPAGQPGWLLQATAYLLHSPPVLLLLHQCCCCRPINPCLNPAAGGGLHIRGPFPAHIPIHYGLQMPGGEAQDSQCLAQSAAHRQANTAAAAAVSGAAAAV
jgi:hypothetical protein